MCLCCRRTAAIRAEYKAIPAPGSPCAPAPGSGTVAGVHDNKEGHQAWSGKFLSLLISFLRGLVVLSPERSYVLEMGPGDIQGPPVISRIQDLPLPGHVCALSRNAPVPTQAPLGHPLGQRNIRRVRRNGRRVGLWLSAGPTPAPQSSVHRDSSSY